MSQPSVDDLLKSGAPAFKFAEKGATCKGVIQSAETRQQTNFTTGALEFWDEAKTQPKYLLAIVCTPVDGGPDYGIYAKNQQLSAIKEALKAADATSGDLVGGTLTVRFTEEKASDRGFPQKIYQAKFEKGLEASVIADDFSDL